ncbi:FAD-binding oxidoreductase [Sphingomonas sp. MMSM20]|uniref:NAD(P)/FAD-dependent oxidoreductase n=1 Tax=Sphingomonas lycopersici TaxID=2951807 RepID=UPI002238629E|nr:FAD-dependent oxidoreductase [Sphingomonas lycopersici]MCW6530129.1 FAD-binding oxidoreductase [Sphingomonas lycopersici]
MKTADFLIIGGGIAGVSAAARLAPHGRTLLLEAESAFGYHSSGRSATFYHFGIGKSVVRGMTAFSRTHFETTTAAGVELSRPSAALFIATPGMVDGLDELEAEMARYSDRLERLDAAGVKAIVPILNTGGDGVVAGVIDRTARRLDSEALQQDYRATLKKAGGEAIPDARVVAVAREGGAWTVTTAAGDSYAAPVLINAAGAWCDEIARLAGVAPLGLQPLRRTIIVFDAPAELDVRDWPFTKTAVDDFYMLPESGRLLACPVDEVPSDPGDAHPEEYDIALAASKVEEYTSVPIRRISHSWAGLRTFTHDRVPVAGFAPDASGFFWLAGQGGYGLQTAPAMSAITEALIAGTAWPEMLTEWGVTREAMSPERLKPRG